MKIHFLLSSFFFLGLLINGFSQDIPDTIFLKNGDTLLAKVVKVKPYEIYYRPEGSQTLLPKSIYKNQVAVIFYSDGILERFEDTREKKQEDIPVPIPGKNAFKVGGIGLLLDRTTLHFETLLAKGNGLEVSLNFIGLGIPTSFYGYQPSGFGMGVSYKFYSGRKQIIEKVSPGFRNGAYWKLSGSFGIYERDFKKRGSLPSSANVKSAHFVTALVGGGYQWILGRGIFIDLESGVGMIIDNIDDQDLDTVVANHPGAQRLFGLAGIGAGFSGDLKIGILLGK